MAMTIDKAQVVLPNDREVKVTRSFKAPRALVYRAYTEPDLLKQWMTGYPGWSLAVCEMDVRPGGRYQWRWKSDDGDSEFGFHGTFREVEPASRLVHTEAYDPGTVGGGYPGPSDTTSGTIRILCVRSTRKKTPSKIHGDAHQTPNVRSA